MTFIYVKSKTRIYRIGYAIATPLFPLLTLLMPVTTTEKVGRAMIAVARAGAATPILHNRDINAVGSVP